MSAPAMVTAPAVVLVVVDGVVEVVLVELGALEEVSVLDGSVASVVVACGGTASGVRAGLPASPPDTSSAPSTA
ncbi:hypothetical protein Q2100_31365, partial [Mycolicibacterium sp. KC 300]|nr:hypothetical protein [Mycolicibacterium arseniciresistens]